MIPILFIFFFYMKRSIISSLFTLALLFSFTPNIVSACSCIAPQSPLDSRNQAAAVFSGTVTTITDTGSPTMPNLRVQFDVDRVWKGSVDQTIDVTTARDSAACGVSFAEGETYIVYASQNEEDRSLRVSLCSRTALLKNASEDVTALGNGESPVGAPHIPTITPVTEYTEEPYMNGGHGVGIAVIVLAIAGLGALISILMKRMPK